MNHYLPFQNETVRDYELMMANREYWDDLGAEWSWSPVEKKLVRLAGLVQQGGSLKKVLTRYAKDHDERYNQRIQHCVLRYILKLMVGSRIKPYENEPLVNRIKCLNKDELIKLLTQELKRDVRPTCWMDKDHRIHDCWELLSDTQWMSDDNLDKIERHHWCTHPEESPTQYSNRANTWWKYTLSLW